MEKKIKKCHFEISSFAAFIMKDKIRNVNETLKYKLFTKSVKKLWITEKSSPISTTASSKYWFIAGNTAAKSESSLKPSCKSNG